MKAPAKLISDQVREGTWTARLIAGADQPDLTMTHLGQAIDGLSIEQGQEAGTWLLRFEIPKALIGDGVQTFVLQDQTEMTVGHFTLIIGEPLAEDLRAEIALLRGELETLKTAFRKHCAEG